MSEEITPEQITKLGQEELRKIMSINHSEKRAAFARTKLLNLKSRLESMVKEFDLCIEVEYTKWMILLKTHPTEGFEFVGIVDSGNPPEDVVEWDLCLPIPDPKTIPEFAGW